jgi:hypothetical protein
MLDSIIAAVDFGADVFKSHPAELVEHSLVWITAIFAVLNQLRDPSLRQYVKPRRLHNPRDIDRVITDLEAHRDTPDVD